MLSVTKEGEGSRLHKALSKPTFTFTVHNADTLSVKVKRLKVHIALNDPISELRSVTCHVGSHSVTCHPTEVNAPRLNPSQTGRYSIYLPRRDGRLSWPRRLLHPEMVYLPTGSHPSQY